MSNLKPDQSFNDLKKASTDVGDFHPTDLIAQVGASPNAPKAASSAPIIPMTTMDGEGAMKAAELKEKLKGIRKDILESTKEKREDEECSKCGAKGHEVDKCWMGKSLRQQAEPETK